MNLMNDDDLIVDLLKFTGINYEINENKENK